MKVLWFSNTSGLAESVDGQSGSWIRELQVEIIKTDTILGLAYFTKNETTTRFQDNTYYFPIEKPRLSISNQFRLLLGIKLNNKRLIKNCLRIVQLFNPDIIHVHGTENTFGLIKKYTKIPVVISIQGVLNEIYKNYYNGFSVKDIICYYPIKHFFSKNNPIIAGQAIKSMAKIEMSIFNINNNYFGRTEWDKNIILTRNSKNNYYHCDELIRGNFFKQEWVKKSNNVLTIVSVINPTLYKGFDIICKTLILFHENGIPAIWKVIGIKDTDAVTTISKRKFNWNIIKTSIKLFGKLDEHQLIKELISSDLFVHPSYIENSSNSICEAQALNIPIIATNCGGTSSLFNRINLNCLFEAGNYIELYEKIKDYSQNNENYFCNYDVSNRHNRQYIIRHLLAIYKEIIINGKPDQIL